MNSQQAMCLPEKSSLSVNPLADSTLLFELTVSPNVHYLSLDTTGYANGWLGRDEHQFGRFMQFCLKSYGKGNEKTAGAVVTKNLMLAGELIRDCYLHEVALTPEMALSSESVSYQFRISTKAVTNFVYEVAKGEIEKKSWVSLGYDSVLDEKYGAIRISLNWVLQTA